MFRLMLSLNNWKRNLIALGSGASTVLAFAPFYLAPFAFLGPGALLYLWLRADPRQAFREGWLFGLGLLGFGVFWMHISIDQFGNVGTGLAIVFTLLFVALVALFYGLAGWLGRRLAGENRQGPALVILLSCWGLLEWVRGWFLGGFPWLALGYSQTDTPLKGFAPLLGVYGVGLAVLVTAGLLVWALLTTDRRRIIAVSLVVLLWIAGWGLGRQQWTQPLGDPLMVTLIQGNIPQETKWKLDQLRPTLDIYIDHTLANWESDLIIWPETAMPAYRHQLEEDVIKPLSEVARKANTQLLVGVPVWLPGEKRYYNAMLATGVNEGEYYKRHLVPFGEFMPLKGLLGPFLSWLDIPMSDFSAGTQERPLLTLAGYPAGISICYEDAFGEEVIEALPDAAFLVNASNDAWFGDSLALPQHLQISRMRALETGRYMLRSTNTGISAIIGPDGAVLDYSPVFRMHVLKGRFQPMQGMTPYALGGNRIVVLLLCLLLGGAFMVARKERGD